MSINQRRRLHSWSLIKAPRFGKRELKTSRLTKTDQCQRQYHRNSTYQTAGNSINVFVHANWIFRNNILFFRPEKTDMRWRKPCIPERSPGWSITSTIVSIQARTLRDSWACSIFLGLKISPSTPSSNCVLITPTKNCTNFLITMFLLWNKKLWVIYLILKINNNSFEFCSSINKKKLHSITLLLRTILYV